MLNYFTITIIIILLIVIIYLFQSKKSSSIESYGEYCGRYTYGADYTIPDAKKNCMGDNNCAWNDYTGQNGQYKGWCGVNPNPHYVGDEHESS
jgi:hypothetical protein